MSETSHGKARPSLPRSADLRVVTSERDPSEGRDAAGRFAPGNPISQGQRWKASIKRLLGKGASNEQAAGVARESFRLYLALIRDLPNDGASARTLAALQARHVAIAAYYTDRAGDLGFETTQGQEALELASKHGQRAERLAVTCLDVSTKLAIVKKQKPGGDAHRKVFETFGAPSPSSEAEPATPPTTSESTQTESASEGQPGASKGGTDDHD